MVSESRTIINIKYLCEPHAQYEKDEKWPQIFLDISI